MVATALKLRMVHGWITHPINSTTSSTTYRSDGTLITRDNLLIYACPGAQRPSEIVLVDLDGGALAQAERHWDGRHASTGTATVLLAIGESSAMLLHPPTPAPAPQRCS